GTSRRAPSGAGSAGGFGAGSGRCIVGPVESESTRLLTAPHVQATLLAEAIQTAEVGFVVWDDDRHYVAANAAACALLGCTLEQLLGSVVGERTVEGEELVERVVRGHGGRGRVVFERFDGGRA